MKLLPEYELEEEPGTKHLVYKRDNQGRRKHEEKGSPRLMAVPVYAEDGQDLYSDLFVQFDASLLYTVSYEMTLLGKEMTDYLDIQSLSAPDFLLFILNRYRKIGQKVLVPIKYIVTKDNSGKGYDYSPWINKNMLSENEKIGRNDVILKSLLDNRLFLDKKSVYTEILFGGEFALFDALYLVQGMIQLRNIDSSEYVDNEFLAWAKNRFSLDVDDIPLNGYELFLMLGNMPSLATKNSWAENVVTRDIEDRMPFDIDFWVNVAHEKHENQGTLTTLFLLSGTMCQDGEVSSTF